MTKLFLAKILSRFMHKNQKYGKHSYYYHLKKVEIVIGNYTWDYKDNNIYRILSYLHDIVEDTNMKLWIIRLIFGNRISDAVYCITDEKIKNRKERKNKTYLKISRNIDSLIVKLADRITNMEESLKNNKELFSMYKNEYKDFRKALKYVKANTYGEEIILKKLWYELDCLYSSY